MVAATLAAGSAPTSRAATGNTAQSSRPVIAAEARWVSPPAVVAMEYDSLYLVDGPNLVTGQIFGLDEGWVETGRSAPFADRTAEPVALEVRSGLAWLALALGDVHHLTVYNLWRDQDPRPLAMATTTLPCAPVRMRAWSAQLIVQCAPTTGDPPLWLVELTTAPSFQLTAAAITGLPSNITAFDWRSGRLAVLHRPPDGGPTLTWFSALNPRQPHPRGTLTVTTRMASDVILTGAYALIRHSPISAVADVNAYDLADPAGPRLLGTWRLGLGGPVDLAVFDAKTIIALDPTQRRLWSIDLEAPTAASETELLDLPACATPDARWLAAGEGRVVVTGSCWSYLIQPAHDAAAGVDFISVSSLSERPPPDRTPLGAIAVARGTLVTATRGGITLAVPQVGGRVDAVRLLPSGSEPAPPSVTKLVIAGTPLWVGLSGQTGTPVRAAETAGPDAPFWLPGAEIGTPGDASTALAIDGQRLAFATRQNGPQLYDVADPSHPRLLSPLRAGGPPVFPDVHDIAFAGPRVAAAMGDHLHVWRIDDPTAPVWLGAAPSNAVRLASAADTIVTATATGLEVYAVGGNGAPLRTGGLDDLEPPPGASPVEVAIASATVGGVPIVAYRSGAQRVHLIDLSDPRHPREFAVRHVPDAWPNRPTDAFLAGPAFDAEGGDVYVAGWQRWYRWSAGAVHVAASVLLPWLGRGRP